MRVFLLVLLLLPIASFADVSDEFFTTPPTLPESTWQLLRRDLQSQNQNWIGKVEAAKRVLLESGLLPEREQLSSARVAIEKAARNRLHGEIFDLDNSTFFQKILIPKEAVGAPNISADEIFQRALERLHIRLRAATDETERLELQAGISELNSAYNAFLEKHAEIQFHVQSLLEENSKDLEIMFERAGQLRDDARRATLDAIYDSVAASSSIEERRAMIEDPGSIYGEMVERDRYREILRRQEEVQSTLRNHEELNSAYDRALAIALDYQAIRGYEEPEARQALTFTMGVLDFCGQVAEKNPFDALQRLGSLGLSVYDMYNGGSPESQRHNELRTRLRAIVRGQEAILKEISSLKQMMARMYAKLNSKLDSIRYIVTASQRLIIEQGLTGLRDCEQFMAAKRHYSYQDETGSRPELGYASYESMRSHYENIEQNNHFHDCVEFLQDATFRPEGLSVLRVSEDQAQAEEIARDLNRSVSWLEEELGKFQTSMSRQREFLAKFVAPQYLMRVLGSFVHPSLTTEELDEKLSLITHVDATHWERAFVRYGLQDNLERFFNPYTLLKLASFVPEVQPFRLLSGNNMNELYSFEEVSSPGFRPLQEFLGNSPEQQFDHYSELTLNTRRLLVAGLAQQAMYSGDILLPILSVIGLSYGLERYAKQNKKTELLRLVASAKAAFADNELLRTNAVLYKLNVIMQAKYENLREVLDQYPPLPGETEEEYAERVIPILTEIALRPWNRFFAVMEDVVAIADGRYARDIEGYLVFLREEISKTDPFSLLEWGIKARKQYKKHLEIDVFAGRTTEPVGDAFFKKRWANPRELGILLGVSLDIDSPVLLGDMVMIEKEAAENPFYDKFDRRKQSLLRMPLRINIPRDLKDQEWAMVTFPGLYQIQSGELELTTYHRQLARAVRELEQNYSSDYLRLWETLGHQQLRRADAVSGF